MQKNAYERIRWKLKLAKRRLMVPAPDRSMQMKALLKGSRNSWVLCCKDTPETWDDFFRAR